MWNSIDNNYEIKIHIQIKTGGLQKKNRPTKFVNCPCGTDDLECYGGRRRFVKYTQFVDMSIFSSLENCFKRSNENRKLKVIRTYMLSSIIILTCFPLIGLASL